MIGAATAIVHDISTSICTCWTSLVVRVIRDGAPNSCTSRVENVPTRWNSAARMSRPKAMAVREPSRTASTEHTICTNEIASIAPPSSQIRPVSPVAMPSSMMSALRLGR